LNLRNNSGRKLYHFLPPPAQVHFGVKFHSLQKLPDEEGLLAEALGPFGSDRYKKGVVVTRFSFDFVSGFLKIRLWLSCMQMWS
jgi:hypothetical protein